MDEDLDFNSIMSGEEIDTEEAPQESPQNDYEEQQDSGDADAQEDDDFNMGNGYVNSGQTVGNKSAAGTSSPNYTSLAQALIADGAIDEVEGLDVTDADSFRQLLDINANRKLNYQQQRVSEALNAGLQTDEIQIYEQGLQDLNNITYDAIEDESDNGLEIRKQLIYQSALSRGMTEQQASREVNKSVKAGTDIEDAKDGLDALKDELMGKYHEMVNQRRYEQEQYVQRQRDFVGNVQQYIMENDDDILNGLPKNTREKMLRALYEQNETLQDGTRVTPLERFAREDPAKFNAMLSYMYVMTNGGTDMQALGRSAASKATKSRMTNLENVLRNQPSNGGDYRYVNNAGGHENDNDLMRIFNY